MVHARPGDYIYHYTVNEYGYRGKALHISEQYDRGNIVVLGDSNSFGTGVNDGEEFSRILQSALDPDYSVINLGVPGYGLTQQIRRFYEFGILYRPEIVILQFCNNDPSDNFKNYVTKVQSGKFVFGNTNSKASLWLRTFLSTSIIQYSQLYNFLKQHVILKMYSATHAREGADDDNNNFNKTGTDTTTSRADQLYVELLDTFAKDLNSKDIRFLMISVNGQLEEFPAIAADVNRLEREGLLEYHDVRPWFSGVLDFGSPEGHVWGAVGHDIVGNNLAHIVRFDRKVR
jgi:hypothetical protein